jgi:hypothetical protein
MIKTINVIGFNFIEGRAEPTDFEELERDVYMSKGDTDRSKAGIIAKFSVPVDFINAGVYARSYWDKKDGDSTLSLTKYTKPYISNSRTPLETRNKRAEALNDRFQDRIDNGEIQEFFNSKITDVCDGINKSIELINARSKRELDSHVNKNCNFDSDEGSIFVPKMHEILADYNKLAKKLALVREAVRLERVEEFKEYVESLKSSPVHQPILIQSCEDVLELDDAFDDCPIDGLEKNLFGIRRIPRRG